VPLPLQVVDAFTAAPFRGNPAGVVLLDGPYDAGWMQAVAAEMKHAETAFLEPLDDGFALRWFTPTTEVGLCGHATLASAHALWDWGVFDDAQPLVFQTSTGPLRCRPLGDLIEMDFPAMAMDLAPAPEGLFGALGLAPTHVHRGDFGALVEAPDAATVRSLEPDIARLEQVDVPAVIVTARSDDDYDVVSRVFAPRIGIPEDPVTGAAHCALAPYWAPVLGNELHAYQASARGGVVQTRLDGDRVYLGGEAVTVLRGELDV
jgi:PhzF family phenazine biosynthesis protein